MDGGKSEFVADPKERMVKWKRRSASLMKQAWELSTLCDTPVCIVITCPSDNQLEGATTSSSNGGRFLVWPNDNNGASLRRMLDLYKATEPKNPSLSAIKSATASSRKNKKIKINNGYNDDDHTLMVEQQGPLLSLASDEAKNVVVAVDNGMEEVQSRFDEIVLARKRERPPDEIGDDAIANVTNNGGTKEKDDAHYLNDFSCSDITIRNDQQQQYLDDIAKQNNNRGMDMLVINAYHAEAPTTADHMEGQPAVNTFLGVMQDTCHGRFYQDLLYADWSAYSTTPTTLSAFERFILGSAD